MIVIAMVVEEVVVSSVVAVVVVAAGRKAIATRLRHRRRCHRRSSVVVWRSSSSVVAPSDANSAVATKKLVRANTAERRRTRARFGGRYARRCTCTLCARGVQRVWKKSRARENRTQRTMPEN